ncbi:putative basic proline-rich protein-like [Iris pallida]|uniref:Basic proline-rich protein-like n=1 Tax=Iris pallida TaxID=29817 RepID=A0AAX6GQF8_IRIPA|nr:putative basic proline-rich protein-like [Iris pallida]
MIGDLTAEISPLSALRESATTARRGTHRGAHQDLATNTLLLNLTIASTASAARSRNLLEASCLRAGFDGGVSAGAEEELLEPAVEAGERRDSRAARRVTCRRRRGGERRRSRDSRSIPGGARNRWSRRGWRSGGFRWRREGLNGTAGSGASWGRGRRGGT